MLIILRFISISLIAITGIVCINIIPASALHKTDHRFTIHGHVFNDQGAPSPGAEVAVRYKRGRIIKKTKTGFNGSYKLLLHLHNNALGIELTVIANKIEKELKVIFDSSDTKTKRMVEINFGAFQGTDKGSNKVTILGAASFVFMVIGACIIHSGRKKKKQKMKKEKRLRAKKKKL